LPGSLSTKALIDFISGRPVACNQVDYDTKNNRPVGAHVGLSCNPVRGSTPAVSD